MQFLFYFWQDQILRLAEENGSLKQNLLCTNASKTVLKVERLVKADRCSV